MEARPVGLDESRLIESLLEDWGFDATRVDHLPLGFGSHHWVATDRQDERRFVTVDDLDFAPRSRTSAFDALQRAYAAAHALRECGPEFVIAPVPSRHGDTVRRLSDRYTLATFPFVDGRAGAWGEPLDAGGTATLVDHLAALHASAPDLRASAPRRDLDSIVTARDQIDAAIDATSGAWAGGPFADPARRWLHDHHAAVEGFLASTMRLLDDVASKPVELVITHGEPHPGNVIRVGTGVVLIDWDTVGLARPERDLWLVGDGDDVCTRYEQASGRALDPDAMTLYRDAWLVADLAVTIHQLRSPHEENEDTTKSWAFLEHFAGST